MVISANLFIIISISCQTHSFKQYFQNFEPENPRTKPKNMYNNLQLVKLAKAQAVSAPH